MAHVPNLEIEEAMVPMAKETEDSNSRLSGHNTKKSKVLKTAFINLAFLVSIGLVDNTKGPVLLDLRDLYETDIKGISAIFLVGSIGSLFGCFFTGYIMGKFPHCSHLFMFIFLACYGGLTALIPFAGDLYFLFVIIFMIGFFSATIDAAGNVLCLRIWRGLDGGPYMHSIHFSFSAGATLAPIFAAPFLSTRTGNEEELEMQGNSTMHDGQNETLARVATSESQIHILFPMIATLPLLTSFGFLYFHFQGQRQAKTQAKESLPRNHTAAELLKDDEDDSSAGFQSWNKSVILMLALLSLFFFLYVGAEFNMGIYLTTFAVECKLQLSKMQGAQLTAIFWGFFAAMRFVAIFAAIKLNPLIIMVISFVLCLVSSIGMAAFAEYSLIVLQVGAAVLGLGMASIYATGLLWFEQYIVITSHIGALFVIAGSLGPDIYPIATGQVISDYPMALMYLNLATVVACVLVFALASVVILKITKGKKLKESQKPEIESKEKEPAKAMIDEK